jgi:putative ABC transport system permease protein
MARMLVRSAGFTLIAVLTLTIGILATTTTVSAVNAVLFRPLPIEEPAEVLEIFNSSDRYQDPHLPKHSYQAYKSLREARTMFEGLLATWTIKRPVNVAKSETSDLTYAGRLQGEVVSGNYFTLLGVRASQAACSPTMTTARRMRIPSQSSAKRSGSISSPRTRTSWAGSSSSTATHSL